MFGQSSRDLLIVAGLTLAALITIAPGAQAKDGGWEFDVGIYGWLPTIDGTLSADIPGVGDEVEIDAGTLIEDLSFTAQAAFDIKRGKWALMADMIYLKETASKSKTLEHIGQPTLGVDYTLNSWIVSFAGGYEVARGRTGTITVMLGARYMSAESTLRVYSDGPLGIDETLTSKPAIWNGFVGATGQVELGKHWIVPYHLDLGTGDSEFSWQGMAGIGYEFKWGGLVLGYRYLDFDQGDGTGVKKLTLNGPELGIAFKF